MPLKVFDSKDAVPEAQRADAVELKDGKWVISEDPAPELGDAGKRALEAARGERDAAKAALRIAEAERDALKREAEARRSGVSEAELQRIREAEEAARKPLAEKAEQLEAENRKLKLTDRVRAAALKAGVMSDRIDDAMLSLEKRTELGDSGGIVVLDAAGKATTTTLEEFLSGDFKKAKPWLFAGTGASGGGSRGSEGGGGGEELPPANQATEHVHRKRVASVF